MVLNTKLDMDPNSLIVKLIDFGFSCRILKGVKFRPKVGTFIYSAPEALKGEPCDEKLDTWGLGCVLFVSLSGIAPFYGKFCRHDIITCNYTLSGDAWSHISQEAKALIRLLFVESPSDRLS